MHPQLVCPKFCLAVICSPKGDVITAHAAAMFDLRLRVCRRQDQDHDAPAVRHALHLQRAAQGRQGDDAVARTRAAQLRQQRLDARDAAPRPFAARLADRAVSHAASPRQPRDRAHRLPADDDRVVLVVHRPRGPRAGRGADGGGAGAGERDADAALDALVAVGVGEAAGEHDGRAGLAPSGRRGQARRCDRAQPDGACRRRRGVRRRPDSRPRPLHL